METERVQSSEEGKKTSTQHIHTGTWYLVLRMIYLVLLYVRKKAQQCSTTQHRRARHSTAQHRTALRC